MTDPRFQPDPPALEREADPLLGRHAPERVPSTQLAVAAESQTVTAVPVQVTEYPMSFTGTAGEYFRLWIVNTALTLVTLGVYLPWARVRTRQYFYGHTWLDGHNFEYRANPLALLKGYLIVGAFFLGYSLSSQFERTIWLGFIIAGLFMLLYPWLVRQSMRFQAANTFHRGLGFRFHGSVADAYVSYGLANVVGGITGIFGLPWAWFMQRRYQVNNVAYGTARGHFRGEVAPFYLFALTVLGITLGAVFLILVPLVALGVGSSLLGNFDPASLDRISPTLIGGVVALYLVFILLYSVGWQYVRGAIMAYVLSNAEIGGVVRARAAFRPWRLVWIGVTNSLAQILTLGLATPWAAVRRARYVLENTTVRTIASLDDFATDITLPESAIGEAATDMLDIQVGF